MFERSRACLCFSSSVELFFNGRKILLAHFQEPRDIFDSPPGVAELRFQFRLGTFVGSALSARPRQHIVKLGRCLAFEPVCQLSTASA